MNRNNFAAVCFGNDADLDLYLTRSLAADEFAEREQHLAGCTACQEQVAQRVALRNRLRAAVGATAPPGLEYRIRQSLVGSPPSAWRTWVLIPVAALALAATPRA